MQCYVLPMEFSVCKLYEETKPTMNTPFHFYAYTDEERSLVCPTLEKPDRVIIAEDHWRGFRIQGVLDFSMIGILADISSLLAKHHISIFAVSTYNTDYIFTKENDFTKALQLLKAHEYEIISS